jgi:hypothetical protein
MLPEVFVYGLAGAVDESPAAETVEDCRTAVVVGDIDDVDRLDLVAP